MKTIKYALLAAVLSCGVACGGAQTKQLQSDLDACKGNVSELEKKNADLTAKNGELQAKADELARLAAARKALHDDLQAALLALIDAGQLSISIRNGMVTLSMPSGVLFDSGRATVKKDAKQMLVQVAGAIKSVERKFLIAGHTDNVSVKEKKAKKFRDNWELASARAYSVYSIISSAGVPRANLAVAGFGDADPVGDNGSDEGKAANRRVEIIVMPNMAAIMPMMESAQMDEAPAEDGADEAPAEPEA